MRLFYLVTLTKCSSAWYEMNKNKNNIFAYIGFLISISVAITVYMMPRERISKFSDYKEGMPAYENVIAPFDFEILRTDEELIELKDKIVSNIQPVFAFNDTLNLHLFKKFNDFCNDYDKLVLLEKKLSEQKPDTTYNSLRKDFISRKSLFNAAYGLSFEDFSDPPLISDPETRKMVDDYLENNLNSRVLDMSYPELVQKSKGIFSLRTASEMIEHPINNFPNSDTKKQRDREFLLSLFKSEENDSMKYWSKLITAFSKPSLIFESRYTDSLIHKAQNDVPLAEGLVKKGETIVAKNSVITKNNLKVLRSLDLKLKELGNIDNIPVLKKIDFRSYGGKIIVSILFYTIFVLMLYFNRKKYFFSYKSLTVLFLLILTQSATVYLSFRYIDNFSPYLVAMSVTSVLTAVFFDMRIAFVTTVVSSIMASLIIGNSFLYIFIPLFSGLLTMYAVNKIRDIFQFIYKTMLFSFLGSAISGIGFYLIFHYSYDELFTIVNHSAVSAALSPLFALTLLTIIEKVFKMPTDITLLQLSDMSKPLLRKLQAEAPGTYHHSITVGNLAEAASEAVHANSLLARVGAYYHDIGKTFKSEYFIENQQNSVNKHDKIAPNMSAFILSAHVKEGIKLAYENHLPEVIIDFIRTHHGATRMEYFYNKAFNQSKGTDEKVNESVYRYPGPKPNSKETAIVMISDVVEAKCRTESSAGADRFRQIINDIIMEKLQHGELDECDLKMNDLSKIREAMIPVMIGMYHQRIKYPQITPETINEKK